jgi:nitrogen regulatory protein P-II 1
MVPNLKRKAVCEAIIKAGASGVTISETRGKGAGQRPTYTGAKGTARYVAEYSRTDTITTIVDDSMVDAIVKAVINSVHTGAKGDGKIFVSSIDETYDITTGQKGKV